MMFRNCLGRWSLLLLAQPLLGGCASYYSHYGKLVTETAAGDTREVLVSWQTEERPGWLGGVNATPIVLETQCSERRLVFRNGDDPQSSCRSEEAGIVWCASPGEDLAADGLTALPATTVCGLINDASGRPSIGELASRFQLTIRCWPAEPRVKQGDEEISRDYPRASSVPYQFVVKRVERGSTEDRKPAFDQRVCKGDS